MLTVKIEQMYPDRQFIGMLKFDDRNMTNSQLSMVVNRHIQNKMWLFVERFPLMTELRWEYEELGQGHYVTVKADEVETPITWVGKLSYEEMVDVTKRAVELQDWAIIELAGYQLRLLQDSPTKLSWAEFVLPVNNYKFDWMVDDNEN